MSSKDPPDPFVDLKAALEDRQAVRSGDPEDPTLG